MASRMKATMVPHIRRTALLFQGSVPVVPPMGSISVRPDRVAYRPKPGDASAAPTRPAPLDTPQALCYMGRFVSGA